MALLTPEQQAEYARRRLGLQSEADINSSRLNQDFGIAQGLLSRHSEQDQQDVGDQIASNGLFQSGIRVNAQGNIIRDYNDNLANLTLQRARGQEDISRGLSTGLANIDYEQVNALAEATRREAEAAQRRAELQALAQQAAIKPPQYPNPVIALPSIPQLPAYQWTAADMGQSFGPTHYSVPQHAAAPRPGVSPHVEAIIDQYQGLLPTNPNYRPPVRTSSGSVRRS